MAVQAGIESAISRWLVRGAIALLASSSGVLGLHARASAEPYSFGVIPQRSAVLSAQYWNPILRYVSSKSGLDLALRMAKTAPDHAEAIGRGARLQCFQFFF